ncbi:pilus assembly protein CpaC, partial [Candidatus Desantisbacteria bacterium CG_4_10_14_0_8_um_filter_48_22]
IQEDEILTSKKVPFLGDIPFLGALFTSKTLSTTQKEVVIYVTPTILTNTNR